MWKTADVEIVRDLNLGAIGSLENADAEDGILLNHDYVDMRGCTVADAWDVVTEEAQFLADVDAADGDYDRIADLIDSLASDMSPLGEFDIGTAGAIYALSAAGAAPITSCNGGLLGEMSHSADVPHILFSSDPGTLEPVVAAAELAEVGLINNAEHAELYAENIPKLNRFAEILLGQLQPDTETPASDRRLS